MSSNNAVLSITSPPITTRPFLNRGNVCLFETHFFNIKSKAWEPSEQGLRRCLHSKCSRKHTISNRPLQVCKQENNCPDAGISCFLLHDNTKLESLCYYGKACIDLECTGYRHHPGRTTEICSLNENCPDALITCFKLHSMSKITPCCHYKEKCMNYICSKRHPIERKEICPLGSMCWEFVVHKKTGCALLHPKIFQRLCRWDSNDNTCRSYGCSFLHRPDSPEDCPIGMQCPTRDGECGRKHPKYSVNIYSR